MKKTLYQLLEVAPNASQETIDAAYGLIAQRVHPDNNPFDPEATSKYHIVQDAYRVLSDRVARARYDASLSAALNPPPVYVAAPGMIDEERSDWKKLALFAVVVLAAGWLYLDHSRRMEHERVEAARIVAENQTKMLAAQEAEKERAESQAAQAAERNRLQAEREQRAEFERFRRDADANSRRVEAELKSAAAEQARQKAEQERRAQYERQQSENRARAEVQDLQRRAREAEYRILYGR